VVSDWGIWDFGLHDFYKIRDIYNLLEYIWGEGKAMRPCGLYKNVATSGISLSLQNPQKQVLYIMHVLDKLTYAVG